MRIAFVSDIHGNLHALEAVAHDLLRRDVAVVVNLGDTLSGPLLPLETARFLIQKPWLHVGGNHERQVLTQPLERQIPSDAYTSAQLDADARRWLRSHANPTDPRLQQGTMWPAQLGPDVALCHGSPRLDHEYLLETAVGEEARLALPHEVEERLGSLIGPGIRLLACGHTHVPRVVHTRSGLTILNPGSVGLQAYDDDHPLPHSVYHRIETGSPDARYAVAEKRPDGRWVCELIAVPYDHEAAAALAEQRERPDWAHALRTGYMPRT